MALAFSNSSGSAKKKLEDEKKGIIEESWSYFLLKSTFWLAVILGTNQFSWKMVSSRDCYVGGTKMALS